MDVSIRRVVLLPVSFLFFRFEKRAMLISEHLPITNKTRNTAIKIAIIIVIGNTPRRLKEVAPL